MSRTRIAQPRRIDVSLIEIGDEIAVTGKRDRGLVTTVSGIVGKRVDVGATRYLMTEEGATITSWQPNKAKPKVTLLSRSNVIRDTLFSLDGMDEVRERAS